MARLGMFCLPWMGHLTPFCGLARELAARGHEVVFFQLPSSSEQLRAWGLHYELYGESSFAAGTFAERSRKLSRLDGLRAVQASLEILRSQAEALFTEGRPLIMRAELDLWVVDQLDYAAATLAAELGAPFVTAIVGLMMHHEDGLPGFSGERHTDDPAVQERDRRFNEAALETSRPFRDFIGARRLTAGLGPFSYDDLWSARAQISQQPAEFEFPRRKLPACFHFTGPFALGVRSPRRPFPWELLTGKTLVYASFGTTQNRNMRLYQALVRATADLDVQVVLSLGGADPSELPLEAPANMLVVPFAPQLEILEKAALMITHAGMNSALECLAAGVPMVAVPIAHDQPGVAARIEWTGTGVRVPASECEPGRLRRAVETVLGESCYRDSARRFQRIIAQAEGLRRAAEIIEQVLLTGGPVLRE